MSTLVVKLTTQVDIMDEVSSLRSPLMKLRQRVDLTQDELAQALGVSRQTISNWETGRKEPRLTLPQIKVLLKTLRLTVDDLPDSFGPPGTL